MRVRCKCIRYQVCHGTYLEDSFPTYVAHSVLGKRVQAVGWVSVPSCDFSLAPLGSPSRLWLSNPDRVAATEPLVNP